jgi:LysM repeat protein
MNLYEFYSSNKKVNITENLIHAKDVESEVITENLRKWFKEKWVRFGPDGKIRGECARGSEGEGKPKCLPRSKAHSLGKKGRASAASKKRREDPNPERRGAAINVSTKVKEDQEITLKNVFENKARATGTDSAAQAQRNRLSAASVGAGPGPGARSQTSSTEVRVQSPVQQVDPAAAARAAARQAAATRVATSPAAPKPEPSSTTAPKNRLAAGPTITYQPKPGTPSIYAPPEEWAKYRAAQSGGRTQSAAPTTTVTPASTSVQRKATEPRRGAMPRAGTGQYYQPEPTARDLGRQPETPSQQANLGIIDQGLSRLGGNLTKRDGKWYHPGGIQVTNQELIKKAEASIARPPGTTASGTVRSAPTTGVSTDTSSALSGGGADDDRTSSPAMGDLPLPSLPGGPSTPAQSRPSQSAVDMGTTPSFTQRPETPKINQQMSQAQRDAEDQSQSQLSISEPAIPNSMTIERGDTLSTIARQNGVTVAELMRLNPQIKDPNKIFAGATLNLPPFTGSTTSASAIKVEPRQQMSQAQRDAEDQAQSQPSISEPIKPPSQSAPNRASQNARVQQEPAQQQELRSNLTPEQLRYAGEADLSRPDTGSTGVIQRMPLPPPEEIVDAIGKAESQKNPDIAFGDVVQNGQIVNIVKANKGPNVGAPLLTAEQWSKENLGGAKKLSDMSVDEVMRFQKYRSDNHSNANAVGAYQFVGSTLANLARKAGIDPKTTKFDQATQNRLLQELTNENASVLKNNGIVPDKVNLYMAHAVGGRGAVDIYDGVRNDPNKAVIDTLMDAWKSRNPNDSRNPAKVEAKRKQLLAGNPHFRDMKVGEYYNYLSGATRGDRSNTDYNIRKQTTQRQNIQKLGLTDVDSIKEFQRQNGLDPDGKIGPNTLRVINKLVSNSPLREEACPHCSGPMFNIDMLTEKKDACYYKVKSRYKVWPSAYASGALVKCRKRGASNWGKSKTNENLYFNVVGTDKKILINEFNMRRDVRGWYLTGDSASSTKLDAFRAFGIPLTEEELNQAGYSGSAATIGVDNPVSPVGSLSKSQRINKKSRSK